MLCSTHTAAFYPTLCANDYVPDFYHLTGTVEAGTVDYRNAVLVGLLVYLLHRLQSLINAAARLIFGLHHTDHISDALNPLHWLRAQERVLFKMAVLMYKASHVAVPLYLSQLVHVADLPGQHCLHSARTNLLLVRSVKLSTAGGRAFPVTGLTI